MDSVAMRCGWQGLARGVELPSCGPGEYVVTQFQSRSQNNSVGQFFAKCCEGLIEIGALRADRTWAKPFGRT